MSDAAAEQNTALVIVPTYNERENVPELLERLFLATDHAVELLVVDDGSPDGTAALIREIASGSLRIHLIERTSKQGLGTAYVTAFNWAMERGYWAFVQMDADLSHDPAAVPTLLKELASADLVIGSRYVPEGEIQNWGLLRRMLSFAGNAYARRWLDLDVRDSTSGFRAYRTVAIAALELDTIRSEGYAFQIEMVRRVQRIGGRVVELPIKFVERASGRSKLSHRIVIEAFFHVTTWGLRDRLDRVLHWAASRPVEADDMGGRRR
jgi:glycosyltransferase involved in cell wall biosynthesis